MATQGRYGTGLLYGTGVLYGAPQRPVAVRVEVRSPEGALKEYLEGDQVELAWEYHRIGGCGQATLRLARPFDAWGTFLGGDDLQIKVVKAQGSGFDLWWRGFITGLEPALEEPEGVAVYAQGYSALLEKVVVSETFTGRDAGLIARDILDNYVSPQTPITYDEADVPTSGFTVDELPFNTTALEALRTVAEMLGREWGVREDLKFYMLDPSAAAGHFLRPGSDITRYSNFLDYLEVINEVLIQGAAGKTYTVSRAADNPKRQAIISNSAVSTQTVADKLGAALLDERQSLKRRSSLDHAPLRTRIEADGHPLKRVVVESLAGYGKYGTGLVYGTGLKYQGRVAEQVETIRYRLGDDGVGASLELGSPRPSATAALGRIERQIQQLAARG